MPTPSPSPCDYVGPAAAYCSGQGSSTPTDPATTRLDPMTSLAQSMAKAAAWVVERLGSTLDGGSTLSLGNSGFVRTYAVAFAASTVLTVMVWLFAVVKRVLHGAAFTTAIGEAVGLLWLCVMASAFTPLALQVVTSAVDAVTSAASGITSGQDLLGSLATTLRQGGDRMGGGPLVLMIVSALTILLAGLLWVLLVVRSMALMVGALLGTVVYSGLVDRSLWSKVRRWAGMMLAIILVKPIVYIALGISVVFTDQKGPGSMPVVAAGIGVMVIALVASVQVFRFVPGYGDDIAAGLTMRAAKGGANIGAKAVTSAAGIVASGIQTHGGRTPAQRESGGKNRGQDSGGVAEGIQAHGTRGQKNNKPKE
jgi:hypothetical protein